MDREPISKKLRFEVFKRDTFTCQYCGAKAPDVLLHVDHIHPVAAGGKSDILNLITACVGCNLGKGARRLDDRSMVERQRMQLEELQERREQLEMMLQWRDESERQKIDVVGEIADRIEERGGFGPNENGRNDIRRWLRRFTVPEILAALDESFDQNMVWKDEEPVQSAWELAFTRIPIVAKYAKITAERPYMQKLAYIQGIVQRRLNDRFGKYMDALEYQHVTLGCPLETMEILAKSASDWDDFCEEVAEAALKLRDEHGQD